MLCHYAAQHLAYRPAHRSPGVLGKTLCSWQSVMTSAAQPGRAGQDVTFLAKRDGRPDKLTRCQAPLRPHAELHEDCVNRSHTCNWRVARAGCCLYPHWRFKQRGQHVLREFLGHVMTRAGALEASGSVASALCALRGFLRACSVGLGEAVRAKAGHCASIVIASAAVRPRQDIEERLTASPSSAPGLGVCLLKLVLLHGQLLKELLATLHTATQRGECALTRRPEPLRLRGTAC